MADAYFPNTSCNIASSFGPASIIINIDLCEWVCTFANDNLLNVEVLPRWRLGGKYLCRMWVSRRVHRYVVLRT